MFSFRPLLILLLCIATLVMRIGGLHAHLCIDGDESPTVLHFEDAGLHASLHHEGIERASDHHDDLELKVDGDALTKLGSLELPALVALFLLALLLPAAAARLPRFAAAWLQPRSAIHLRPPLRGPPRFSLA